MRQTRALLILLVFASHVHAFRLAPKSMRDKIIKGVASAHNDASVIESNAGPVYMGKQSSLVVNSCKRPLVVYLEKQGKLFGMQLIRPGEAVVFDISDGPLKRKAYNFFALAVVTDDDGDVVKQELPTDGTLPIDLVNDTFMAKKKIRWTESIHYFELVEENGAATPLDFKPFNKDELDLKLPGLKLKIALPSMGRVAAAFRSAKVELEIAKVKNLNKDEIQKNVQEGMPPWMLSGGAPPRLTFAAPPKFGMPVAEAAMPPEPGMPVAAEAMMTSGR